MTGFRLYGLVLSSLMAAALCLIAPHSLPFGPVPINLATFGIYVMALLLPPVYATQTVILYLVLGMCGLPVFAGYQTGAALIGATAGFLWGYLPAVLLMAWLLHTPIGKDRTALCLLVGCAVILLCGTLWYALSASVSLPAAALVCVLPFVPVEAIKIVATVLLAPRLHRLSVTVLRGTRYTRL